MSASAELAEKTRNGALEKRETIVWQRCLCNDRYNELGKLLYCFEKHEDEPPLHYVKKKNKYAVQVRQTAHNLHQNLRRVPETLLWSGEGPWSRVGPRGCPADPSSELLPLRYRYFDLDFSERKRWRHILSKNTWYPKTILTLREGASETQSGSESFPDQNKNTRLDRMRTNAC